MNILNVIPLTLLAGTNHVGAGLTALQAASVMNPAITPQSKF